MKPLTGNDPRVKSAARRLNIAVVLRAWEEDGVIYIQTPWATHEVATDPADVGEDPVTIEDFTVIPGIGPATARKLHTAGIATLADLKTANLEAIIPRQADAVKDYFQKEQP